VILLVLLANPVSAWLPSFPDWARLLRFSTAYQDVLATVEYQTGPVFVLKNGVRIPFRSTERLPDHPFAVVDVAGIFACPYPEAVPRFTTNDRHLDPGRFRNYRLLKAVYGDSAAAVRRELVGVKIGGTSVQFNRKNGAAAALGRVAAAIEADPVLREFVHSLVRRDRGAISTFTWRTIQGTGMLSAHSFGIAIDIVDSASSGIGYWRWVDRNPERAADWPLFFSQDRIWQPPPALVAVFEREGFIWGGKWYHFDPIHFEYRPELTGGGRR
jgi:hypothetical protein